MLKKRFKEKKKKINLSHLLDNFIVYIPNIPKELLKKQEALLKELKEKELKEKKFEQYDTDRKEAAFIYNKNIKIRHAIVHCTSLCNSFGCIHCYESRHGRSPNEFDFEDWKQALDKLIQLGVKSITLIGGEYFLMGYCFKLLKYALEKFKTVSVQTNGILDEEVIKIINNFLIDYDNFRLWISLEGKESFNDMVRGKKSFKYAINTLESLREHILTMKVGIRNTVFNENEPHDILEFKKYFAGLNFVFVRYLEYNKIKGLSPPNQNKLKYISDLIASKKIMEKTTSAYYFYDCFFESYMIDLYERDKLKKAGYDDDYLNYVNYKIELFKKFDGICPAGVRKIALDQFGNIFPCQAFIGNDKFKLGNIKDDLSKIIHNLKLFGLERHKKDLTDGCRECNYFDICKGGCYFYTTKNKGGLKGDPYCPFSMMEQEKPKEEEPIPEPKEEEKVPEPPEFNQDVYDIRRDFKRLNNESKKEIIKESEEEAEKVIQDNTKIEEKTAGFGWEDEAKAEKEFEENEELKNNEELNQSKES